MTPSYLKGASTPRRTPQDQPIPGREAEMTENSAGGFTFQVTPLERLRRFLILGSEGGTYYASEAKLTEDNARAVRAALDSDGVLAVAEIINVSKAGRAAKQDPAIYALAMAAGHPSPEVRAVALAALPEVCRTGTALFHFMDFVKEFRGRGRALNRAVAGWYLDQDVAKVAYQVVKYRQRDGWTHRDVLRLVKPNPDAGSDPLMRDTIFKVATENADMLKILALEGQVRPREDPLAALEAYARARVAIDPAHTVELIEHYGGKLPREAIRPEHLSDRGVNAALVESGMPMTALIRNLANLTRYGVIEPMGSELTTKICEQIVNPDALRRSRVHPVTVLSALKTYESGRGLRGSNTWTPNPQVAEALEAAFYASFGNVEKTGKRHLLSLDVSSSMTWGQIAGIPSLTPAVGAAAMCMVTARVGDPYQVMGFGSPYYSPLIIRPSQSLNDVLQRTSNLNFGGTDCALPMLYAIQENLPVDCFTIFTDNETWAGRIHPTQALREYREKSGINARMIVVGMTSTGFSIADPQDSGMLDCCGFDTAAPTIISDFAAGRI